MSHGATVVCYTDGSVSGNGTPGAIGGWSFYIACGERYLQRSGQITYDTDYIPVTNNRSELYAVLEALRSITLKCCLTIYSDSNYVIETLNGNYSMNKNEDLFHEIISKSAELMIIGCTIEFKWCKGHTKENVFNSLVDKLATNARCGLIVNDNNF